MHSIKKELKGPWQERRTTLVEAAGIEPAPSALNRLSACEKEILKLIADGKTTREIAELLSIGNGTVASHRLNIRRKLNLDNAVELLKYAVQKENGFVCDHRL